MAKIENGFIVCDKDDPILKFRIPAALQHWIEASSEFRGVSKECLILETLYDHFHRLRSPLGRFKVINPLERSRRERMHWEVFHLSHNKRLTDETYVRIRGVPRSKTNIPYDVLKSHREVKWDEYLALRAENIKALEQAEFDLKKRFQKRKPRRTEEEMEQDKNTWEHVLTEKQIAKGRVLTTTSGLPNQVWIKSRAKETGTKD